MSSLSSSDELGTGSKVDKGAAPMDTAEENQRGKEEREDNSETSPNTPPRPQIRHDWYQTDSNVVVSVLLKTLHVKGVDIRIQESSVEFWAEVGNDGTRDLLLRLHLAHPIVPSLSLWKKTQSKVEIKLAKSTSVFWKTLEENRNTPSGENVMGGEGYTPNLDYPSSSVYRRDWDKIAVDIDKVEEEEAKAMTGDATVNKLFQDIYSGGSDEVRKAMNKSFMESGGTVLSTNWKEVEKSEVQVKPPDGMEFKKWDQ